jgi:hypothetical protein
MFDWLKDIFRWFAKKNTRVVSCIVIGLDGAGKFSFFIFIERGIIYL